MGSKKKLGAHPGNKKADQVAELIVKGLEAAPRSSGQLCLPALARALPLFHSLVGGVDYVYRIRSRYGHVLDAYASFASSVWSADQLAFLLDNGEHTKGCGCKSNQSPLVREIHLTAFLSPYNKPRSALYVLITHIFEMLCSVCLTISRGKLEKHKASEKWPISAAAMIPRGPEATIEAFAQWVIVAENPSPLRTLGCLVQYCPSLRAPLNANSYFDFLIEEQLRRQMLYLRNGPPADFEVLYTTRSKADYMMDWYYLFNGFISYLDGTFIGRCFQEHATSIYRSICLSFEVMPDIDFKLYTFARDIEGCWFGHALAAYSGMPSEGEGHLGLHPVLIKFREQSGLWTPDQPASLQLLKRMHIDIIRGGLMALFRRTSCSNPHCKHTCESLDRSFRICSGCRCTRYCSEECQTLSWNVSTHPHKKFCKLMKILLPLQMRPGFSGMISEETSLKFEAVALEHGVQASDFFALKEHFMHLGLFQFQPEA